MHNVATSLNPQCDCSHPVQARTGTTDARAMLTHKSPIFAQTIVVRDDFNPYMNRRLYIAGFKPSFLLRLSALSWHPSQSAPGLSADTLKAYRGGSTIGIRPRPQLAQCLFWKKISEFLV